MEQDIKPPDLRIDLENVFMKSFFLSFSLFYRKLDTLVAKKVDKGDGHAERDAHRELSNFLLH